MQDFSNSALRLCKTENPAEHIAVATSDLVAPIRYNGLHLATPIDRRARHSGEPIRVPFRYRLRLALAILLGDPQALRSGRRSLVRQSWRA